MDDALFFVGVLQYFSLLEFILTELGSDEEDEGRDKKEDGEEFENENKSRRTKRAPTKKRKERKTTKRKQEIRNIKECKGSKDSNSPVGTKEAVCATIHYNYTTSQRESKVKAEAPPHPPLPPAEAGKNGSKKHLIL